MMAVRWPVVLRLRHCYQTYSYSLSAEFSTLIYHESAAYLMPFAGAVYEDHYVPRGSALYKLRKAFAACSLGSIPVSCLEPEG